MCLKKCGNLNVIPSLSICTCAQRLKAFSAFFTYVILFLSGPDLPEKVYGLSMVASTNGILAIAGNKEINDWPDNFKHNTTLESIHKLSCKENNCEWIEKGKLKFERVYFNVIPYSLYKFPKPNFASNAMTTQPMLAMFLILAALISFYQNH